MSGWAQRDAERQEDDMNEIEDLRRERAELLAERDRLRAERDAARDESAGLREMVGLVEVQAVNTDFNPVSGRVKHVDCLICGRRDDHLPDCIVSKSKTALARTPDQHRKAIIRQWLEKRADEVGPERADLGPWLRAEAVGLEKEAGK